MPNYYSKVMDILFHDSDNRIDYVSIVREIAKRHPKMVIDAVHKIEAMGWKGEVAELARHEGPGWKLSAIKLWRAQTGLGLKEAKDAVEDYTNDMVKHG